MPSSSKLSGERTILILDDNTIDRETCRRYLLQDPTRKYRLVEHNALEGALEMVEEHRPDLILLDYHLHDGTGVEFLQELSALGGTRAYPVVMLTGTGSEAIAVQVMKAGAQDYLVKERLSPEVLQRAVEGALYKGETDRLLEAQRSEMERLFHDAQEANARKDHFLAALSHELRTPLTPVLLAVSSVDVDTAPAQELREVVSLIRRNIELEARLIDDLLDLTRISRGKFEIEHQPVDLHGVLRHAVETCRDELDKKKQQLTWELHAKKAVVSGDAARLQQVFWNIIKNAAKFTPEGGKIVVTSRDSADDRVEVAITDTGIGIKPEYLDRIFDAFEQGNSEITRRYGGLGLGLAISKALVEAHHGVIFATSSQSAGGAQFHIVLPCDEETDLATSAHEDGAAELPKAQRPLTLLLVEDHPDSAFSLARVLQKRGYVVHIATTAAEALRIFQGNPIDGVVSDLGLPDATGTELITKLRAIKQVPAIALSGYGMEADVQRSLEAGFSHHLTKPVNWKLLESVLAQAMGKPA